MDTTELPHTRARKPFGWLLFVIVAVVLVGAVVTFVNAARAAEESRLERIEQAEDKYAVTYLRKAGDGEGGGMWRMINGTVLTCRIDGPQDDPTLACGEDGTPPMPTR